MIHLWRSLKPVEEHPAEDVISEDLRVRVAHSIAGMERHRHALAARIGGSMDLPGAPDGSAEPEIVAALLMRHLIDGGSDLAAFGGLRDFSQVVHRHRDLGIDGRHYSRFGVALPMAIQSILGPSMPLDTVSAWADVYWLIVRAINQMKDDAAMARPRVHHGPKA